MDLGMDTADAGDEISLDGMDMDVGEIEQPTLDEAGLDVSGADQDIDLSMFEQSSEAGGEFDMSSLEDTGSLDDTSSLLGQMEESDGLQTDGMELGVDDVSGRFNMAELYINMEDMDSARAELEAIASEGSPEEQAKARQMLDQISELA
jgi:FimV-like protein